MSERELYAPIKSFLEAQGYDVKSEVHGCDVVATRPGEPPLVVELKARFNVDVLLQAVDRLAVTERVYIAFADAPRTTWRTRHRAAVKLCRMLGLGVLTVRRDGRELRVTAELDPAPYRPRANVARKERLLAEHAARVGDFQDGGVTRTALVTAYRQDALRVVAALSAGPLSTAELRARTGVAAAATLLNRDVYGWFERVGRGVYQLTPNGERATVEFGDAIAALLAEDRGSTTTASPSPVLAPTR